MKIKLQIVFIILTLSSIFYISGCSTGSLFQKNAEFENKILILQSFNYNDISNPGEKIYIKFDKGEKSITGFGGCNTLYGRYSITGSDMKIKAGRTKMECDENMQTEEKLLQLLDLTNEFREITSSDKDYLRLLTTTGESIEFRVKK